MEINLTGGFKGGPEPPPPPPPPLAQKFPLICNYFLKVLQNFVLASPSLYWSCRWIVRRSLNWKSSYIKLYIKLYSIKIQSNFQYLFCEAVWIHFPCYRLIKEHLTIDFSELSKYLYFSNKNSGSFVTYYPLQKTENWLLTGTGRNNFRSQNSKIWRHLRAC